MKIALIDPSLFTWPYDHALAESLRHRGHDVILYGKYLAHGEQGNGAEYYRELFYPGLEHRIFQKLPASLFLLLKGLMHCVSLIRLWMELRRVKPDIIHFQWVPLPLVDIFFIPAFRRIAPVILTVHDSMPFNANPRSRLQRVGAIRIMRYCDHLIVHTQQACRRLGAHGLYPQCIAHGPLGSMMMQVPETNKSDDDPVIVLLFGKLKPYKGADSIIRAIASLPVSLRDRCRLHIAGKPYMDTGPLHALARDLGVENNIVWDLRFIEDWEMAGIFARADMVVMPYREIDASGVLMLAITAGKPIIASRIGLFAELLEEGKHGYLIEPEDIKALSEALARLTQDKGLRLSMENHIRDLKHSIPDWSSIAESTEALYVKAIAQRA